MVLSTDTPTSSDWVVGLPEGAGEGGGDLILEGGGGVPALGNT